MKNWEIENFLEVKNNELTIDGVSSTKLAAKYGTPLFVFSEKRIRENIARLTRSKKEITANLKICYAAKANSNMAILRTIRNSGADIEVNSGGELWKALKIGFRGDQIIFNGTSKDEDELTAAIKNEIFAIQADSFYEIELIEEVANRLKKRANISLRIVPEIETATHPGLKTAMNSSKFGMTFDDARRAFERWSAKHEFVNICGMHLHVGSQTPDEEPYTTALMFLFERLLEVAKSYGHQLSHLNLGGGFPVHYLRDASQSEEMIAENQKLFSSDFEPAHAISAAWKAISESSEAREILPNITLLLEPGRSVIADAGVCLTTVRNIKSRPSQTSQADNWLLTDAGFNILLSMETYKWYYHLISANRAGEVAGARYKVAGPLCDGADVYFDIEGERRLPEYRNLPENVLPGEVLALLNCGAYSIAQAFQYNGRFLPAMVLIRENGNVELIRRRDSFEDLVSNDVF